MFECVVLSFAGASTFAQEGNSGNPDGGGPANPAVDRSAWALQSEDQAVAGARQYLGIADDASGRTMTGELTTRATDATPFLSARLIGRPI